MAFEKDIVVDQFHAHGIHVLIHGWQKLQVLSSSRIILSNGVSAFFTQLSSTMKVQHTEHMLKFSEKSRLVAAAASFSRSLFVQ